MTEDAIRAAAERYRTAPQRALGELGATLRTAIDEGARQVDVIKATGFSREFIRRVLNPAANETVKQANAARRQAAGDHEGS